jgi:hypothetical protein
MNKIRIVIIIIAGVFFGSLANAADLPSKGKKPPTEIYGAPGPLPPGPGAPVGEGLGLLMALGAAYGYKKYKQLKQDK